MFLYNNVTEFSWQPCAILFNVMRDRSASSMKRQRRRSAFAKTSLSVPLNTNRFADLTIQLMQVNASWEWLPAPKSNRSSPLPMERARKVLFCLRNSFTFITIIFLSFNALSLTTRKRVPIEVSDCDVENNLSTEFDSEKEEEDFRAINLVLVRFSVNLFQKNDFILQEKRFFQ